MQKKLILVVDEDEAVRDSLRFSLGAEGFAVFVFESGRQLLAEGPLSAGDCFVVDQHAQDMTGLELISALRARNIAAPAILIAGRPDPELRAQAAAAGVSVVEKPLLDFTLVDSVRQFLADPTTHSLSPEWDSQRRRIMIKDVLVNLQTTPGRDAVRDYAISVAGLFEAHLTGVAFAYEPINLGTIFDGAAAIIDGCREEAAAAARTARDGFERAAQQASLSSEAQVINLGGNAVGEAFSRLARNHDLSIVGQARPDSEGLEDAIIQGALFGSGRPVLIVPWIQNAGVKLDRVLVCWDGSRNAARAVADAMPLLRHAGTVEVITIDAVERRNEIIGADIAGHLARHSLKVELKSVIDKANDVAVTILNHVADSCADLVVMGGYGHSRLREFVLGGATRGMLRSMTVPTLMAH